MWFTPLKRTIALAIAAPFFLSACDESGLGSAAAPQNTSPDAVGAVTVVSGGSQLGLIGQQLEQPIVVRVTNNKGNPKKKFLVNFVVVSGGGTVFAGSALTNSNGVAQDYWTLGPEGGQQVLEARAVDAGSGAKLVFTRVTATASDPGGGQSSSSSVTFSQDSFSFTARGETATIPVTALDQNGNALPPNSLQWTSGDTNVARIDAGGRISAWDTGSTTIVARGAGAADTATVVVTRGVAQVEVVAPTSSLQSTEEAVFTARLKDASGSPVAGDLSAVSWSTSSTSATVDDSGRVRAVSPGTVSIRAEFGGVVGAAQLVVTDPPMPGTVIFQDGLESGSLTGWDDGVDPQYHSVVSDASLARSGSRLLRVDYPQGGNAGWLGKFFGPGYDAVRVRYWVYLQNGWKGETNLVGFHGSRTDNLRSAYGQSACPDGTNYFSAFLGARGDGSVEFRTRHVGMSTPCLWSTGSASTSYTNGQELEPGMWHRVEFELRANTPGLTNGSQSVWVDGELVGQWNNLDLRAGNVLAINSAQLSFWTGSSSPQGQYLLIDDVQVSALGSQSPVVTSVQVDPATVSLAQGASFQLGAFAQYSGGGGAPAAAAPQGAPVPMGAIWSSNNESVAAVSTQGTLTAVGPGTATISATVEGVTGSAQVTVTGGAGTVNITTPSLSFSALGVSSQLQVSATNEIGGALTASSLSWTTSNASVASVASNGRVTAQGNGTAAIVASYAGVSSSVNVTVAQTVSSVSLSPTSASLDVGANRNFNATIRDSNGRSVSGTSVSWSSSNSSVASVNSSGRVQAASAGNAVIRATAGGITGTASVSVSNSSGGGGGGGGSGTGGVGPNEPGGFTTFNNQPWNSLGSNGWGHVNRQSRSIIVSDPTAPASPSSVLEHQYPAGYRGGSEPAADFINVQGNSEVYVSFWFKASPGWDGHMTGTNKIMFLFNADSGRNLFLAMKPRSDGAFELVMYPQGHREQSIRENAGVGAWFRPNRNSRTVQPGQWHRIEAHFSLASGTLRWWQDGTLIAEHAGLALDGNNGFGELQIAPTWGGGGDAKQKDDYFRFDHFYISVGN